MNLEEVEKSIDKEINELSESISRLYKDWDKEFTPVERMLLIHSCFHIVCVVESNILNFCNNYLNAFPPVSLFKDEEWIDELNKIKHHINQIKIMVDEYGDKHDDDLLCLNEFLSKMHKVLYDVDNDKKAIVDRDNDPSKKLQTANFNINTTQAAMIEHVIYIINTIKDYLGQLVNKKNRTDVKRFNELCENEYQEYLSNVWPTERIKIINESKFKSNIKEEIVSELDAHEYGKQFMQSDHSLSAIASIFSDREKNYKHEDLYIVFKAMLAIDLLEDIKNNPLKYQDFGKTLPPEAKKEILFACAKEIDGAKDDDGESLFKNQSDWIAPYRVMVEEQLFNANGYKSVETFFMEINQELSYKIDSGSLSHANNGIYMRPHEKWDSSKSSSPGIIERRIKIANKFHELYLKKRHEYLNNHK